LPLSRRRLDSTMQAALPRVTTARVEAPSTMAASKINTKTTSLPRRPLILLATVRTSMVRSRQRVFPPTITLTPPTDSNKLSRLCKTASLAPKDPLPPITTTVLTASLLQPTASLQPPITTSPRPPTTNHHTHMEPLRFSPRLPVNQLVDLVLTDPAAIQAVVSMETTLTSLKCKLPSNQDSMEHQPQHLASHHTPTSTPPLHPMEQQVPSTNPRQTKVFMAQTHSLNLNLNRLSHSRKYPILLEPTEELERVVLQAHPKTHSVQACPSEALAATPKMAALERTATISIKDSKVGTNSSSPNS